MKDSQYDIYHLRGDVDVSAGTKMTSHFLLPMHTLALSKFEITWAQLRVT